MTDRASNNRPVSVWAAAGACCVLLVGHAPNAAADALSPHDVARRVDASFLAAMQTLLSEGNYPAIATHDPVMIEAFRTVERKADEFGAPFRPKAIYVCQTNKSQDDGSLDNPAKPFGERRAAPILTRYVAATWNDTAVHFLDANLNNLPTVEHRGHGANFGGGYGNHAVPGGVIDFLFAPLEGEMLGPVRGHRLGLDHRFACGRRGEKDRAKNGAQEGAKLDAAESHDKP